MQDRVRILSKFDQRLFKICFTDVMADSKVWGARLSQLGWKYKLLTLQLRHFSVATPFSETDLIFSLFFSLEIFYFQVHNMQHINTVFYNLQIIYVERDREQVFMDLVSISVVLRGVFLLFLCALTSKRLKEESYCRCVAFAFQDFCMFAILWDFVFQDTS